MSTTLKNVILLPLFLFQNCNDALLNLSFKVPVMQVENTWSGGKLSANSVFSSLPFS